MFVHLIVNFFFLKKKSLIWSEVYPRVKAAREKEDPKANEDTTELLLRLVDSLSEQGHSFSRTPPSYGVLLLSAIFAAFFFFFL